MSPRIRRLAVLALLACALLALGVRGSRAQESGGSFGGSAWDDEPSGGGGGGGGSWGSSGGGYESPSAGSSASQDDSAERQRQAEEQARRDREAAEAAARRAEEERIATERARKLALPPAARIRELGWPATPAPAAPTSTQVRALVRPLSFVASASAPWPAPSSAVIAPASHELVGDPNYVFGGVCACPAFLFVAFVSLLLSGRGRRRPVAPYAASAPAFAPHTAYTATPIASNTAMRLSIAFDWTARAALQAELAAMATRFDLRTRPGLTAATHAVRDLLAAHAGTARYGTWELATGDARTWFQNRANDLRARFRAELVRNDQAATAPGFVPRESEGQGLVVVSIVVAGKQPIRAPGAAFDLASLAGAIRGIADRPSGETLALEVIWSPAAENDRMSSYELEKLYPELHRIAEGVGARQCLYCKGPFPTELGKCPNCGAPV